MYTNPILLLVLALVSLTSCTNRPAAESDRPRVVCTTGMIADLVAQIGGEEVEVDALMGPGVDPHLYKATSGDLTRLREADLIIYNGHHLEGTLSELLGKMAARQPVVAVADGLPVDELLYADEQSKIIDPHIWFDVGLWARTVPFVTEALVRYFPGNEAQFRERSKTVSDSLMMLDGWVRGQMATVPPDDRLMITAHDAFGYFGRAYDVEVAGLQGISTLSEFGVGDLTAMVDMIVNRRIRAVFVEHSVSPQALEAVVSGCAARGHEVVIGGTLYSDALGEPGSEAGTYAGMVRTNVRTIVAALYPKPDEQ